MTLKKDDATPAKNADTSNDNNNNAAPAESTPTAPLPMCVICMAHQAIGTWTEPNTAHPPLAMCRGCLATHTLMQAQKAGFAGDDVRAVDVEGLRSVLQATRGEPSMFCRCCGLKIFKQGGCSTVTCARCLTSMTFVGYTPEQSDPELGHRGRGGRPQGYRGYRIRHGPAFEEMNKMWVLWMFAVMFLVTAVVMLWTEFCIHGKMDEKERAEFFLFTVCFVAAGILSVISCACFELHTIPALAGVANIRMAATLTVAVFATTCRRVVSSTTTNAYVPPTMDDCIAVAILTLCITGLMLSARLRMRNHGRPLGPPEPTTGLPIATTAV
jgi:hypothetical protein